MDQKKKEIVKYLLKKEVLVSSTILDKLEKPENIDSLYSFISKIKTDDILLIGDEIEFLLNRKDLSEIDWKQFEKSKVLHEKGKDDKIYKGFKEFILESAKESKENTPQKIQEMLISKQLLQKPKSSSYFQEKKDNNVEEIIDVNEIDSINEKIRDFEKIEKKENDKENSKIAIMESIKAGQENKQELTLVSADKQIISELKEKKLKISSNSFPDVKIVFSYGEEPAKQDIQDFVSYYNRRYEAIERMLRNRRDLNGLTSINRIVTKREKDNVSLIGLVRDKQITKNNNIILVLEDSSGEIKVLATKTKPEVYEIAKNLVLDEVIGVAGSSGDNIVFANKIVYPDVPLNKELKKLDEEVYAVFLSDIHVGSNNFLPDQFNKFLDWINGNFGNEQHKSIASKVKYVFIAGDLVDGVGIYPGQENELIIKEINEQYRECAKFLSRIPAHIRVIICAGNHDAMRLSEPQLPLYQDFAQSIWELPNTIMVSNPALINIASKENFPGFDILLYHGYSFDYYVANVDSIRQQGGYDRADLIMKFLLQRRHLAPTHKSTLYIADIKKDNLVIDVIPDIFATGHIHKSCVANYRNVTMICGSCWQAKTAFQEKVGHNPEPARVPIVNLQTRETKVLKF